MFSLRNKANNVDGRLRKCCVFVKDVESLYVSLEINYGAEFGIMQ